MRRFYLDRKEDATGISGTGRVVEGVVFSNGLVALTWFNPRIAQWTSVSLYPDMDVVEQIHGHGGKTEIVWVDPAP